MLSISIIIPCRNNAAGLISTLNSLTRQKFPHQKWEVIVVDNNSNDNTYQAALDFIPLLPSLKVERELRSGAYAARNKGIRMAAGDILAFMDADMTVSPDWLHTTVDNMRNKKADYMGCRINVYPASSSPSPWETYDMSVGFPVSYYIEKLGFAPTSCLFVNKIVFAEVGYFDARLISGGDLEFGTRVKLAGFKQHYYGGNRMNHPARTSLYALSQKMVRVARGHIDLKWYYPERFGKLRFLAIVSALFKPARGLQQFRPLMLHQRICMQLLSYYLLLVQIYSQIVRYAQLKFTRTG